MSTVVCPEARGWARTLTPAQRAAIHRLSLIEPGWNWVIAIFLALWLAPAAVAVLLPSTWVRVAACALAGIALHGLGILMHEGVHGNLFRERRRDRWAAFALGLPVLVSCSAYRVTHLAHHRHTRSERDPDEIATHLRGRRWQTAAFWVWGLAGLAIFLVHVPLSAWRLGTPADRRRVAAEYAVLLGVHGLSWVALGAAGRLDILAVGWLAPMAVAGLIVNLRGWAEHLLTRPDHPLTRSRTITSTRLVSALLLNLNYHLEHHLFPGVPWYNLPRLHRLLLAEYRAAGASIYRSYLRFFLDALRGGIHGPAAAGTVDDR